MSSGLSREIRRGSTQLRKNAGFKLEKKGGRTHMGGFGFRYDLSHTLSGSNMTTSTDFCRTCGMGLGLQLGGVKP